MLSGFVGDRHAIFAIAATIARRRTTACRLAGALEAAIVGLVRAAFDVARAFVARLLATAISLVAEVGAALFVFLALVGFDVAVAARPLRRYAAFHPVLAARLKISIGGAFGVRDRDRREQAGHGRAEHAAARRLPAKPARECIESRVIHDCPQRRSDRLV
ncbi:MAG TPA: hypothetical protein VFI22_15480 [Thermomicrobiales bacterium]|nr:hypothetical protein [Thermomicrobiales bacterium]